jgi:hypothetical protein
VVSGFRLAVDYGTSFTAAAVVDGAGPEVLEFSSARNSRYLPSMVLVDQRGELHVGTRAVAKRGAVPAENVCVAPKRQVGPAGVRLGDRALLPAEIVGATLTKVAEEAFHRNNGGRPDQVVMTHPAAWAVDRRNVLRTAAASAGLVRDPSDVVLVPEPVAAVRFYASAPSAPDPPIGSAVAVYDLGGGTFDCAVLRRTDDGWVLAGPPGGDERLGGEDFDEALLEWVADRICVEAADQWAAFEDDESPRGHSDWVRLLELIRSAKEELSTEESTEVGLPPGALSRDSLMIHRSEFTILIGGAVDRSMNAFAQCLDAARVTPGDLAAIYLTGGSSRIPVIKGEIHRRFGVEPITYQDPKAITALGALVEEDRMRHRSATQPPDSQTRPSTHTAGTTAGSAPPPRVTPQGPTLVHADCPDVAAFARVLGAVAAFRDAENRSEQYRLVAAGADQDGFVLMGGTPKRSAMATIPIRSDTVVASGETVLFDPAHVYQWARGRSGAFSVSGTSNSLVVRQSSGAEPREIVVAASVLQSMPAYGNPGQEEPIALLDLAPGGVASFGTNVVAGSAPSVHVVCGADGVVFDGYAPQGDYHFVGPDELYVPRPPLAAALQAYQGTKVSVAIQPRCLLLISDDDSLSCAIWHVDAPQAGATARQAEVATVRISPKAVLGGVGAMGVKFHLIVDGIEYPTKGWEPVTFELRPGRHEIECYNTSAAKTYSRAKTTLEVFAGQQLNLRFQQGMTTFSKGKLVLE